MSEAPSWWALVPLLYPEYAGRPLSLGELESLVEPKKISWGALHYLIELLWELNEPTSAKYSEQGLRQVNAIWLLVINVTRNEWLQFNIIIITTPQIMSDMPSAMSDQYTVYIYWWIHRYIYAYIYIHSGSVLKNPPAMQDMHETWVQSLGWEDPLEKGMATYSSVLAWKLPWTEEPGRLWSMALQKSQTWLSD